MPCSQLDDWLPIRKQHGTRQDEECGRSFGPDSRERLFVVLSSRLDQDQPDVQTCGCVSRLSHLQPGTLLCREEHGDPLGLGHRFLDVLQAFAGQRSVRNERHARDVSPGVGQARDESTLDGL